MDSRVARIIDSVLPRGTVNVITESGSEVENVITSHGGVRKAALTGSTMQDSV